MPLRHLLVACLVIGMLGACSKAPTPYQWALPKGIPEPIVPADNPMTVEGVALGETLFFDTQLSGNGTQSCASCHDPSRAFSDPRSFSVGSTGELTKRHSMALVNVAYNTSFTWAHSGLTSIEQQLLIPLFGEAPIEMGARLDDIELSSRLNTKAYRAQFKAAFGDATPTWDRVVKALSSYVRSLVSFDSPFDRYAYQGEDNALSEQAIDGLNLFFSERMECFHCHGGLNFTQSSKHENQQITLTPFHHTGLVDDDAGDLGLYEFTLKQEDKGHFRAPTLRNIALTAPYMHDGSINTLADVIDFYAAGGRAKAANHPRKSPFVPGFNITEEEKQALVAFLQSLTGEAFEKSSTNKVLITNSTAQESSK